MEVEGASVAVGGFLNELEVCVSLDSRSSVSLIYLSVSEIKSVTAEIEQAISRGTLIRFFNSTDDVSSLKSHNDNLDRIISKANVSQLVIDCTFGH